MKIILSIFAVGMLACAILSYIMHDTNGITFSLGMAIIDFLVIKEMEE
jgi:hypothetical protein